MREGGSPRWSKRPCNFLAVGSPMWYEYTRKYCIPFCTGSGGKSGGETFCDGV